MRIFTFLRCVAVYTLAYVAVGAPRVWAGDKPASRDEIIGRAALVFRDAELPAAANLQIMEMMMALRQAPPGDPGTEAICRSLHQVIGGQNENVAEVLDDWAGFVREQAESDEAGRDPLGTDAAALLEKIKRVRAAIEPKGVLPEPGPPTEPLPPVGGNALVRGPASLGAGEEGKFVVSILAGTPLPCSVRVSEMNASSDPRAGARRLLNAFEMKYRQGMFSYVPSAAGTVGLYIVVTDADGGKHARQHTLKVTD